MLTDYAAKMVLEGLFGGKLPDAKQYFVRYLDRHAIQLGPFDCGKVKLMKGKITLPYSSCDRAGVTRIELYHSPEGPLIAWCQDMEWGPISKGDEAPFPLELR
jgi:hypothetical protein